jgi:hypothetical protein
VRFALLIVFLACASTGVGQEQERKLVDRLLKPDTTLANASQDKKFETGRSQKTRSSSTRSFYVTQRNIAKRFAQDRSFQTREFDVTRFATKTVALPQTVSFRGYSTVAAREPSQVWDSNKRVDSRAYSGNRPFLVQGKSQKSLQRKNQPLTIEQVRELLNKNK